MKRSRQSSNICFISLLCLAHFGSIITATVTKQPKLEVGEISKQKCNEYWPDQRNKRSTLGSGFAGGGVDAMFFKFPHMAALGYGDYKDLVFGCGGSLISPKFVMTAAHCTDHKEIGKVKYVRLGVTLLRQNLDFQKSQNINISRIIIHPDYKPPLVYNDIALLELSKPAEIAFNVKPACLYTEATIPGGDETWLATGWGITSYNGNSPDHLQQVNLKEYSFDQCSKAFNANNKRKLNRGIDNATQICAGEIGQDTCDGDSGGPIQIYTKNKKYAFSIIGVTSFGKPCLLTTNPGVYTRVSPYIEWIEKIVWIEDHNK